MFNLTDTLTTGWLNLEINQHVEGANLSLAVVYWPLATMDQQIGDMYLKNKPNTHG